MKNPTNQPRILVGPISLNLSSKNGLAHYTVPLQGGGGGSKQGIFVIYDVTRSDF